MRYGSGIYILSVAAALLCVFGAWALLRRCSRRVQRITVLGIMLLNLLQHFMKPVLYPQYAGTGFSYVQTAYNVCALLIISSPAVCLWGNRFLRNCLYVIGTVAGIGTIVFPVWFMGMEVSELGWEYARFYICHLLLLLGSALPLLLRHHRPEFREFWHVGVGFFLALVLVLANNVIMISAGCYTGADSRDIYGALRAHNPCMMMGPPPTMPWIADAARALSPDVFLGDNPAGAYVPILWYAIPVYLGINLLSFVIFAAMDHKNFRADLRRLIKKQ